MKLRSGSLFLLKRYTLFAQVFLTLCEKEIWTSRSFCEKLIYSIQLVLLLLVFEFRNETVHFMYLTSGDKSFDLSDFEV